MISASSGLFLLVYKDRIFHFTERLFFKDGYATAMKIQNEKKCQLFNGHCKAQRRPFQFLMNTLLPPL